ncbi:MAG: hypothetical protein VX642_14310 [Bdellovibrionota bacterium]|nr:hypothetical protein [Bdellovibrionota bacterium]
MEENAEDRIQYRSYTLKKTFVNSQISNEKTEIVEFLLRAKAKAVNPKSKIYQYELSTLQKDGFVDLKSLAFPELGEKILYTVDSNGKILTAGVHPNDSEYGIPFFFAPEGEVGIGETWVNEVEYNLSESGVPLRLELTSILKGVWECGLKTCAEIELSGRVLMNGDYGDTQYESEFVGRMLVGTKDSRVLWQEIRTGESLGSKNTELIVYSCIESKITSPFHIAVAKDFPLDCVPNTEDSLYVSSPFKDLQ